MAAWELDLSIKSWILLFVILLNCFACVFKNKDSKMFEVFPLALVVFLALLR